MNCIKCGSKSKVYDSRPYNDTIKRRRQCKKCGTRYSTIEVLKTEEQEAVVQTPIVESKPVKRDRKKHNAYKRMNPLKKRILYLNFDQMTDEEIEAAIHSGDYI